MIKENVKDPLIGRSLRLVIKDPDDDKIKQSNPQYHPFEATIFGKITKYFKGTYGRRLYVVELDEILQETGKPDTKCVVIVPAYEGAILLDLKQKQWAGVMLSRPQKSDENFEGIDEVNIKERITAVGSGIAKLFLL
jgi:hypothetical protein